ncbi:MAG: T9SS type A sorting domain-containing protein [Bacteroidia bacterium]|nr:T9SS type A sorting domain-containing protein [Bacteroidia bacterium]
MKKFILSVLCFISLTAKSQTSVYHSMPDSNAAWTISQGWGCSYFFTYYLRYYSLEMTGDTLIGGQSYHKLEIPMYVFHSGGQCNLYGTWIDSGNYAGSFREDSSLRKVYVVPPGENTEQVLYDFNLQVGDTIYGFLSPESSLIGGGVDTVISIDSVLIGNEYHKRLFTNELYQIYWIEGIGSTFGFLEPSWGSTICPPPPSLDCFSINGTPIYPDSLSTCDFLNCANSSFNLIPDTIEHSWLVVTNVSGMPPFSYQWSWGDGSTDTTAYPSHTYDSAGYYTICLTITDNTGCTATICDSSSYLYKIDEQMITINAVNSLPIGIKPVYGNANGLSLFPNPANNLVHIKTADKMAKLCDITGKTLLQFQIKNGKEVVDVSGIENGIYLIQTERGVSQKLIVRH